MASHAAAEPVARAPLAPPDADAPAPGCLNCEAPLAGPYCAACGQPAVDLAAPTWHVVRQAVGDAADLDGRVLRTARALGSPGRLAAEFLRGRRAPYLGPLKLALLAGSVLTATWISTRGVDARYYGMAPYEASSGTYIQAVVRGSLAAAGAVAVAGWVLARERRRLLDEVVFALYLVAALSLGAAAVLWLGTLWKATWGTAANTPAAVPPLPYLLFLPACSAGVAYVAGATRRVHGGPWWAVALRALLLSAAGLAAVTAGAIFGAA